MTAAVVTERAPKHTDLARGLRAMAPVVVSYVPFGLAVGSVVAAGPEVFARWLATVLVYGGTAQIVLLRGLDTGAAVAAVVGALAVNLRLIAYSTSLAPSWRDQPRWFRLGAAAVIVDPVWALAERDQSDRPHPAAHRAFVVGAGLMLTVGFLAEVTVGAVLADRLGAVGEIGLLGLALPVTFAAVVAPRLRDLAGAGAAIVGGAAGWFAVDLPPGAGLVVAVGAGAVIGAFLPGPKASP